MIGISKRAPVKSSGLWASSLIALALLYTPASPGFWSGASWAQERPIGSGQARPIGFSQERSVAQRPLPVPGRHPIQPDSASVVPTVSEPTGGALGTALASCDKGPESSEPFILPGTKGEVKLDRCYRGRDHLLCSFNALLIEAKSLIEGYGKIVEARYPDVGSVEGICKNKPDNLASDLQSATDFAHRFRWLKAEYNVRTSCAGKIEQSLKDVTLRDMAQAPEILKSMIDSIEADVNGISVAQAKVAELAEKIDSSQKAIITIRMIHRAMCPKEERALSQADADR